MTTSKDPISEIKAAEEQARKDIETSKQNFDEKLRKYEEELEAKTKKFEVDLRSKGTEKLENVKKEASELFKSKMATSESAASKAKGNAKANKEDAVNEIINMFMAHIKK